MSIFRLSVFCLTFGLPVFPVNAAPNILVIIADDLGTEALGMYGIGEETAVTPNLDSLAAQGVRFEGFWSQPSCSPTRAALLTGRYAFRTGVRSPLRFQWANMEAPVPQLPENSPTELWYEPIGLAENGEAAVLRQPPPPEQLPRGPGLDEIMLPKILAALPEPYTSAAVGKWHLGDFSNGGVNHPNLAGFDYYSGGLFGAPSSYFAWRHLENGKLTAETGYYDQRVNDDAINWISDQQESPWFMWLSYSNPHTPVHLPPTDLLHSNAKYLPANFAGEENNRAYFYAQVEAMDTLIGELLESMSQDVRDNTYVIFLGDNGTVSWDNPSPPRDPQRVKGTVYEGGVSVPLIITGPGVPEGRQSAPIAHVVDLFSTILDLTGTDHESVIPENLLLDSVSFAPQIFDPEAPGTRTWVLTEGSLRGQDWSAIRDRQYKLVISDDREEFYDLLNDNNETDVLSLESLLGEARTAYDTLKSLLDALVN